MAIECEIQEKWLKASCLQAGWNQHQAFGSRRDDKGLGIGDLPLVGYGFV
jgi:hypothetical protein